MTRLPKSRRAPRLAELDYMPAEQLREHLAARRVPLTAGLINETTEKYKGSEFTVREHRLPVVEDRGRTICIGMQEIYAPEDSGRHVPMLWIPGGFGISRRAQMLHRTSRVGGRLFAVDWIGRGTSDEMDHTTPAPRQGAVYYGDLKWDDSYQFYNLMGFSQVIEHIVDLPGLLLDRLTCNGTSWGSFYSFLLAAIDPRIRFVVSSFGTGYLDLDSRSIWESAFDSMTPEQTAAWLRAFDPGRRAREIKAPVFFETAANDKFFSVPAVMRTLAGLRGERHLLVLENQDHFLKPYSHQNLDIAASVVRTGSFPDLPEISDVRWLPSGPVVEADIVTRDEEPAVFIVFAEGDYCGSFAKSWRRIPAEQAHANGTWQARIPFEIGDRPCWWYVLVENRGFAVSSLVQEDRLPPGGSGPRLAYRIGSEPIDRQPVGDRIQPKVEVDDNPGGPFLRLIYDGTRAEKCVVYVVDGDAAAAARVNAITIECRLDAAALASNPHIVLVSDYHAHDEQSYGVQLNENLLNAAEWQTLWLPLNLFGRLVTRNEPFACPKIDELRIERLCGVGFFLNCKAPLGNIEFRGFSLHPPSHQC